MTSSTRKPSGEPIVEVEGLVTRFGSTVIHDHLSFTVDRGEIMGVVGGSGSGKSVMLRTILGLIHPAEGRIRLLGEEITGSDDAARSRRQRRMGMLFQDGALFSQLTIAENVAMPLIEHANVRADTAHRLAIEKLVLVGLKPGDGGKLPSELSGGMRKRAGLARALALDPELLLLDEPTAGLDPISAEGFDQLILDLNHALGVTVMLVTHDLDTLHAICDRVAALVDKQIRIAPIAELARDPHPWLQSYFGGPRGRAALRATEMPRASAGTPEPEARPDAPPAR
ncbi:ABC transporter ATP-binding protein [Tistrella mobilis]|uniref:ABC transporter related protein n=1 Tax=Tistrella mobilis (strain KA081020-065) TaxID=1110502 RepID=I3TKF1_TISMK|nr:ATP-binding cassette domain-containing protein [Tistrella mobilis]AFK53239.1 ABC transporter related protein [Tistrella mobilis KA081020-065]